MDNNQLIETNPFKLFWGVMPKMIFAVITALVVPIIAFFVLMLLIFGVILIYSMVFEPQVLRFSEVLDALGTMFGVAIFATAYLSPCIGLCAGSLGFPVAVIGWHLKLIRKRISVLVGSVLGIICAILFELIGYSGTISRSANGITYMLDGSRTFYGWIEFGIVVIVVGLLGALGGYSFWFAWEKLTPKTIGEDSLRTN